MQTLKLKTEEAPTKWWAAMDARNRNLANKSHYPQSVQVNIDRMKLVMDIVYSSTGVYESYGKRGVSVKVAGAAIKNRKALRELEAQWAQQGFVKKVSPQGVIYRLEL